MIPIKLSVQGLYSYQDIQEIDFQRLTSATIFGIFGKVGSGKTSLLEAISFVLYGKTERLNDQDRRAYNMMNLKSKQLTIDFEFRAGTGQELYKFVYESKRHPKKHHEISPGERRTFIWQENDWHPIGNEKEDIAVLTRQILGLDYDNFKRTIIIPQNQFREFLELTPRDRTEMMNRLFKLDQYDLAGRVSKLSKVTDNQAAELRGLLAPLEAVTPEAVEQARTDIAAIQQTVTDTTNQIAEQEPIEQQLLHLQKQHLSLIWARNELEQWLVQEPRFQAIQQQINRYEHCRLLFQADLALLHKLQLRHSELTSDVRQANHQLTILADQLPVLQATYLSAKTAYENRDTIHKQLSELDTVQAIRTLQNSISQLTKNQRALETQQQTHKTQLEQYKQARKNHERIIEQWTGQESKLEQLYKVQNWFSTYKPLKKQADKLQEQLATYEAKMAQLKQRKDEALNGVPPEWTSLTLKTLPPQIDQALDQLKTIHKQREAAYQDARLTYELQRYAENLTDGSPCPLCGSLHHPIRHNNNAVEADVLKAADSLEKVNQRIEETISLRLTIKGLESELRALLENGKNLTTERADIVQQLTAHEDLFVWTDFSPQQEDTVNAAIREASSNQKQLQDAQRAIQDLNQQLEKVDTWLTQTNEQLARVTNDLTGIRAQLALQVASLVHYQLPDVELWTLDQIDMARQQLDQRYRQTKTDFEDAEQARTQAEKQQAIIQEQVLQLQKQLTDMAAEQATLEQTVAQNLTISGLNRAQVEQILASNLDIEQEKRRVQEYTEQLNTFRKLVTDLETELASQPFDAEALANIQEQLQTLRDQKDSLHKELGKATNILTTLERQWTEKQQYQARFETLELRQQDLKKMDDLFRAQGFVNYVSSVYLKNLCESANARFFTLTHNQLKLELDEKNNFQVRDYLNGGEVRSVKTLSGGQTFQAALSLALALSDNIQQLTQARQNLFFLDEGFGTLDKDSLQTVFKTLKALRSENRVVGIISHVDELQQEVDTYIRAEATENGSRIVRSWE